MTLLTNEIVQASNPLGPTPPPPPIQGCNSATGVGTNFKTCAFYVVASNAQTSNDAGMIPECTYVISAPEIYLGRCNSGATPLSSGFRFQNVSVPIPAGQTVLASYIEFTVDGTYTNKIVANLYGQIPTPTPAPFSGTNSSDVTSRPTAAPTRQWIIESAARVYNMGDPWSLGETRRSPDVTPVLSTIKGSNWQTSSNVVLLFKSDYANSTAARRVTAFERAGYKPARLVVRVGQIPKAAVSYYWQSVSCTGTGTTRVCSPIASVLRTKATNEAQRNQPVLVVLDFGNPRAANGKMGTTLVSKPSDYVPTANIESQIKFYISEFVAKGSTNSKLWLGVGTNNAGDLMCANQGYGTSHGTQWAAMINRLNTWVGQQGYNASPNPPDKIKVSGAVDFEKWTGKDPDNSILRCNGQLLPEAPPSEALQWAQAYSAGTNHSYIYFGDYADAAEGLGLTRWGADLTWELSWGIPEAYPLPEIYTRTATLAEKWQSLARYSAICQGPSTARCRPEIRATDPNWVATKGRAMQFLGAFTNFGEQNCNNSNANSPNQGWLQLYRRLVVDLYTDNSFPIYSSDITYEDSAHQTADTCPIP